MSRRYALAIVFLSSSAVLVLEILAGRLLAPYLGVTLETFTGIIGTILAGISLGAWYGGQLADKESPARYLGPLFIASGLLTILAPSVVRLTGPALRAAGPLEIVVAASSGFLVPAALLAAIPPVAIRLQLDDLKKTGRVVGGFSATSTVGAIFGTFATGFVLIASVPSRAAMLILGCVLITVGAASLVQFRGSRSSNLLGIIGACLVSVAILSTTPPRCEFETEYYCARISIDQDRPTGRAMWLDTLRHSYVDLDDPRHLEFRYTKLMADALATRPAGAIDALYIGGGGLSLPGYISAVRPGSTHLVLELDSQVIEIAQSHLGVGSTPGLQVAIGDARVTINQTPLMSFDIVVGDAFGGPSVPWHLTTQEFLTEVSGRLRSSGWYIMNLIDYPPHGFSRAQVATLSAVFENCAVMAPPDFLSGERGGNVILIASDTVIDLDAINHQLDGREAESVALGCRQLSAWTGNAQALTDDFAPVDQLISRP